MRIVYLGTPSFAVAPLAALAQRGEVVGVITKPDAASGRGKRLRPCAVAQKAEELELPLFKLDSMRTPEAARLLAELAPDLCVTVAFGELIPEGLLGLPPLGFINVHASLLPRWRGAAPVQRAILAGDEEAGVSIMRLAPELDAGPYCRQSATPVADKSADELLGELSTLGADDLIESLPEIASGRAVWTEQDAALVTYARKVAKADIALRPALAADECARRVRASSNSAPARAVVCGRSLRVVQARTVVGGEGLPAQGTVALTRKRLLLGCADGALELLAVKPDGGKQMPVGAFLAGLHQPDELTWWEV